MTIISFWHWQTKASTVRLFVLRHCIKDFHRTLLVGNNNKAITNKRRIICTFSIEIPLSHNSRTAEQWVLVSAENDISVKAVSICQMTGSIICNFSFLWTQDGTREKNLREFILCSCRRNPTLRYYECLKLYFPILLLTIWTTGKVKWLQLDHHKNMQESPGLTDMVLYCLSLHQISCLHKLFIHTNATEQN